MTRISDTLPGITAIASVVARLNGIHSDDYVAGLWRADLIKQMLWASTERKFGKLRECSYGSLQPSLSWSASPSGVTYSLEQDMRDPIANYTATVISAACTLIGTNTFGAVHGGRLTIRGLSCKVWLSFSHDIREPSDRRNIDHRDSDDCAHVDAIFLTKGSTVIDQIHRSKRGHIVFHERSTPRDHHEGTGQYLENVGEEAFVSVPSADCLQDLRVKPGVFAGCLLLLWLDDVSYLVLAYSKREPGAHERFGLLTRSLDREGRTGRPSPGKWTNNASYPSLTSGVERKTLNIVWIWS